MPSAFGFHLLPVSHVLLQWTSQERYKARSVSLFLANFVSYLSHSPRDQLRRIRHDSFRLHSLHGALSLET